MEEENKPTGLVDKASENVKLLQAENERMEKNIAELKEIQSTAILSGTAGGHIPQPTEQDAFKAKAEVMAKEIVGAFRKV
jgi:hypothetical protein